MKKSIVEIDPCRCYVCGTYGQLERHHIFEGNKNRKWSEKYGLIVHLCMLHHRDNRKGAHSDAALARRLHELGQYAFEQAYPDKHFRDIFGINYLDQGEIPNGFDWK